MFVKNQPENKANALRRVHAINVDLTLFDDCLIVEMKGHLSSMTCTPTYRCIAFDGSVDHVTTTFRALTNGLMQLVIEIEDFQPIVILYFTKQHQAIVRLMETLNDRIQPPDVIVAKSAV